MKSKFPIPMLFLVGLCAFAEEKQAPWVTIDNPIFSFTLPPGFKKDKVQPIDSFVEAYSSKTMDVSFDCGMFADNFSGWPSATTYESLKVDGTDAKIGTVEHSFGRHRRYSTQIHFQGLSMFASCNEIKDVQTAHTIFKSIRFKKR